MFKYFFFLFFIGPLFISGQTQQKVDADGFTVFYYENGKVSSEGMLRDGKPDGYWKTYAESGIIKSEGNRKDFQLDSTWKFYNEKGMLAFEFNYKNGKKNGLKNTYDVTDGFLISSENYKDDVKDGNTFYYYKPNDINKEASSSDKSRDSIANSVFHQKNLVGNLKKIVPYSNGKMDGIGYEFSPDSTIISITHYQKDRIQKEEKINRRDRNNLKQGVWKTFYPSGLVKSSVEYTDGEMDGYLKEYFPNGSLKSASKYVRGVLQTDVPELEKLDLKTQYYQGGFVKSTATYKNGKPEGAHRTYDLEGKVIDTKVYSDGILVADGILDTAGRKQGPWKEYYINGQLKSVGAYKNSKKIGEWIYYYENGKIEQIGSYDKNGRTQGVWRRYYPCLDPCTGEKGNLWREENYRNNKLDGSAIEYSDSGKVITKGEYIDNEKEGPWMLQLVDYREEGNYKAGKRDGIWKHYYVENDKLRFVGNFIDGVPDGKQVFYYPNGKEKQVGKYVGGNKEGEWKFFDETGYLFLTILYKNDIEVRFDGIKVVPETVE